MVDIYVARCMDGYAAVFPGKPQLDDRSGDFYLSAGGHTYYGFYIGGLIPRIDCGVTRKTTPEEEATLDEGAKQYVKRARI